MEFKEELSLKEATHNYLSLLVMPSMRASSLVFLPAQWTQHYSVRGGGGRYVLLHQ